eukprot:2231806-Lingulodinium_polyedra.AAC.1
MTTVSWSMIDDSCPMSIGSCLMINALWLVVRVGPPPTYLVLSHEDPLQLTLFGECPGWAAAMTDWCLHAALPFRSAKATRCRCVDSEVILQRFRS